jgi:hypothetical protein
MSWRQNGVTGWRDLWSRALYLGVLLGVLALFMLCILLH